MATKVIVTEFSVTFGSTSYDCKQIPAGIAETCEPVEVTVGTDVEQRFTNGALTNDEPIEVILAGTPPTEGTAGTLTLTMKTSTAGATPASASVACGTCIVTSVKPTTITAGGERANWWTVTFQPNGTRT